MDKKMPKERLLLWLGLIVAALVWVFGAPKSTQQPTVKAPKKAAPLKTGKITPDQARELILGRNIFQPLVVDEKIVEELPVDYPPLDLPYFPRSPEVASPEPPPKPASHLAGIVLRGVVESGDRRLALLEGPNLTAVYLAPGQSQGGIKVEKLGEDWVELSAGKERKTLRLPGEFSVEPLGEKKGGGQN